MPIKKAPISEKSTKQQVLDAYNELQLKLEEQRIAEMKPAEKIQEIETKKLIQVAEDISSVSVQKKISDLKIDIASLLANLADKLDSEVGKYNAVKNAVAQKETELQEIYEIQKQASTLSALIEAQNIQKYEFEEEMFEKQTLLQAEIEQKKTKFEDEMRNLKADWEKERAQHAAEIKERDMIEQKQRDRDKDEFLYNFNLEQKQSRDKFAEEKANMERELTLLKESTERNLKDREKSIAESEAELNELRKKVSSFPQEMQNAIENAVKNATANIIRDAQHKEALLIAERAGETKVMTTRIAALEQTIKEQQERIASLSTQIEKSYTQVQNIALKAVESSSNNSYAGMQQIMTEQMKKTVQEK